MRSRCLCVDTSNRAISITLASVTSSPSFITLAQILSDAMPLIIVSRSTRLRMSPSGYLASFTNCNALVWKSSKLSVPWNSLFSSTIAMRALDFGEICSSNSSKYQFMLFRFASVNLPSVSHLSTRSIPTSPAQYIR